jgi:lysophospholipase L1-like esterase
MKLLTIGDSFTYGEELLDINNAWPYILGQRIGYEVTNLGNPASSNDRIVRVLLEYLIENCNHTDLVIIGWSLLGRAEFADELGYYDIWPGAGRYYGDHRNQVVKYISTYHSREAYFRKYLQQIILVQEFLKHRNIKYVMLDVLANDYYRKQHQFSWNNYENQIDQTNYIDFNKSGMCEWASGTPTGSQGHFLEEGHRIVANRIYEHIRHLGWVS